MSDHIQNIVNAAIGRRASEDAQKKKSERLQAGKKRGKTLPKHAARRSIGKAASKREGFGVKVKIAKNGNSISSALSYVELKNKNHEIVFTTAGISKKSIEATFDSLKSLRPDIENNVSHFIISLPPSTNFDTNKFNEMVEFTLKQMDIDPLNNPCVAVQHRDKAHFHVHVLASRCGLDSTVLDGHNMAHFSSEIGRRLEVEFSLNLIPRNENMAGKNPCPDHLIKKYHRERAEGKTAEAPAFVRLQFACDAAIEASSSLNEYKANLNKLGVELILNEQIRGGKKHLSGVSYQLGELKYSSTTLGDKYTKYGLLKTKGIEYHESNAQPSNFTNNRVAENEPRPDVEPQTNDVINQELALSNLGNSSSPPAEQTLNSNERRKLRRAAEQKSANNTIINNGSDSDIGNSDLAEMKAKQAANVLAWEKAETQKAIDQKREQLEKRVLDAQAFKFDRFMHDPHLPNKFIHLVIKNLAKIDESTIAEKEGEVVKFLLPNHNEQEVIDTLCNQSLLHQPMPREILLGKNPPSEVIEMAARVEAEREAIIEAAKATVAKAAKEIAELQKINPAPKSVNDWKPPVLGL